MPGDQEHDSAPVVDDPPMDEDTESGQRRSIEENRAGFMLLDF